MRVELPLGEALANGYQFYGFPLAILALAEETSDWILTNYIDLAYDPTDASAVRFCFYLFDYAQSPWLETVRVDRFWIAASSRDIVDVCRDSMAAGYYPYLNINEFYVEGRKAHGKHDQSHDVLLCGFDDEADTFTVYGYADGRLGRTAIDRSTFRASYQSLDHIPNTCYQVLFYRAARGVRFAMDVAVVRDSIEGYLSAANPSTRYASLSAPMNRRYGTACYEPLERYLDAYLAGREPYDTRDFHVLWEHKRLMGLRLSRLAQITGNETIAALAEDFRPLERDALMLRDGMMRHEFARTATSRYALSAPARLTGIRDRESEILEKVLGELHRVEAPPAVDLGW